jgi:hypothetical protein
MTAAGYVVKDITITIDSVDYACAVVSCVLTPAVQTVEWTTSCPDGNGSDTGATKWTLDLDVATSSNPLELARILMDNDGAVVTFSFVPDGVNNPTETVGGSVRCAPVPFGGTAGSVAQGSVSLPVIGQPVWTP